MASGLTIQRSAKGLPLSGSVNFREYPDMIPIFEEAERKRKKNDPKNPAVSGIIPKGYISSDEFWTSIRNHVDNIYKEYGLI